MDHKHATPMTAARPTRAGRRGRVRRHPALVAGLAVVLVTGVTSAASAAAEDVGARGPVAEVQSLDGSGNNLANPQWGQLGRAYSRVGPTAYADGRSAPANPNGPNPRAISNRLINDVNQNVFAEGGVTQWLWAWGQFLDHTFGLAEGGGPAANIPFNRNDPMETFTNDLGVIPFTRDAAVPGTGVNNPREQINTVSSYIDAFAVYGGSNARLDYLRDGSLDGNPTNNAATLMLPGGYLPTSAARGGATLPGPAMAVDGRLRANPSQAMLAGDVRANENIALTSIHTLFAREHNRIVAALPNTLTAEQKFQVARRVVIAEQQYITYNDWLPSAGVRLPSYRGYNPSANATLSNEFATVGYRAHSMIHGEFEIEVEAGHYTDAQLNAFRAAGIAVVVEGDEVEIAIPLNLAFFNPNLLKQVGLGQMLKLLGGEAQYNNDEMIDNQLRAVLFQVPRPGQTTCIEPVDPACFNGVVDLGAIDIARTREHGVPNYNALRQAYGLAPRTTFRAITGEATDAFPADPQLTRGNEVNDPDSLDFTRLFDKNGAPIALDSEVAGGEAIVANQRTTVAARLRALYGNINNVDAFMGMIAEPHVAGTEFGELQLAIWSKQFQALRDGDRFFYGNNADLAAIRTAYGIDYRRSLGQVIASNTEIPASELRSNVFVVPANEPLAPSLIKGVQSGRCIDVPGSGGTADNTRLEIFDCGEEADDQAWNQQADGTIRVANSGKCLDMLGGSGSAIRTPAVIFTCNGAASQRWRFVADGHIVNQANGRCLDAFERGTANRTPLIMFTCQNSPNQIFNR